MKFAAIFSVATLGLAQASTNKATTKSKAQVIIHGVKHDFSDADLAIISESAMDAYNVAQKDTSYFLKKASPTLHFGVDSSWPCSNCAPDDDATFDFGLEKVLMMDIEVDSQWPCSNCAPDDDALESSSSHQEFVNDFCFLLSQSTSGNLANAHHCSFTFIEDPGHLTAPLKMTGNKDESAQGFLSFTGLLHDLSKKDIAIVENMAYDLYNEAFAKSGASLKSVKARSTVQTPVKSEGVQQCINCPATPSDNLAWPCSNCAPDDDAFSKRLGNVLLMDIEVESKWPCSNCAPDDDSFVASTELESMNLAFSEALCSALRSSGKANLANVDDCAMSFFMVHAEKA